MPRGIHLQTDYISHSTAQLYTYIWPGVVEVLRYEQGLVPPYLLHLRLLSGAGWRVQGLDFNSAGWRSIV